MLVGRTNECERLEALLEAARSGRSGSLLVTADPGVGKTALLDYAATAARGMRVLRGRGSEYESDLPFAALYGLLRPIFDLLDRIPPNQARSLRAALALESGEADRLSAYAGTLSLLAEAADDRPLLLLVDDVQWVDTASAEALLFTARRLAGEALALVFSARRAECPAFYAAELPGIDLETIVASNSGVL